MANKEHTEVLKRRVSAWNKWRGANPAVLPEELTGTKQDDNELARLNAQNAALEAELADFRRAGCGADLPRERFGQLFDSLNVVIWSMDVEARFTYVSRAARSLLGYEPEALIGKTIDAVLTQTAAAEARALIDAKNHGIPRPPSARIELVHRRNDGTQFWGEVLTHPILDDQNRIVEIQGAMRDITVRKRAEEALRESEEKYRELVENANSIILRMNKRGIITFFNEYASHFFGFSPDEIIGRNVVGTIVPATESTGKDLVQMIRDIGVHPERYASNENENMCKDGTRVWVLWTNKPIFDAQGQCIEVLCIGNDITERKRAEQELRFRNIILSTQQEASIDGILVVDEEARILSYNSRFVEMWGLPAKLVEDRVDEPVLQFVTAQLADSRSFLLRVQYLYEHRQETSQDELILADGRIFECYSAPMFGPDERYYGRVWYFRDITTRKQAEEALRESEIKYRTLIETTGTGFVIIEQDGLALDANPEYMRLTGHHNLSEIVGRSVIEWTADYEKERNAAAVGECLKKGYIRNLEIDYADSKGSITPIEINATRLESEGKVRIIALCRDITDRKRAEEALRRSEELFSKAFNMSPYPTVISALDTGLFIDANDSFLHMLGYTREELIGRMAAELSIWPSWDVRKHLAGKLMERGSLREEPVHLLTKMRDVRDLLLSSEVITINRTTSILSIFYDITDRKILEARLRQAQKMEAIGTLAGGIAHDFNNILGAVLGYAEMALREPKVSDRLMRYHEQIYKAGIRAKDLIKQILAFSRQSDEELRPLRISPIINEVLKLLRASLPSTITIYNDIQTYPDTVLADPTQIHQILMNLCTNAAHAMHGGKGELRVSLSPVEINPRDACMMNHGLKAGMYLKLSVSDTGHGIDPVIMDRIFDPFFTTKKPGEGTGMGLSMVHGIVKSYNGAINVSSEVGKGSTFHVYFPLLMETEGKPEVETIGHTAGGSECILFVDDEESLVELGKEMLSGLGYVVIGRTSSPEALELFRARPSRFDLVITDMTMPNMTGIELAREIMHIRPDVPVILCTGFSETITPEKSKAWGIKEFIMKPIIQSQLAEAVRRAVDHK